MEVSIQSLGLRNFEMPFCNFESCDTMLLPASRFSANNFLCFATRASAAAMQSLFMAITDDGDAEQFLDLGLSEVPGTSMVPELPNARKSGMAPSAFETCCGT